MKQQTNNMIEHRWDGGECVTMNRRYPDSIANGYTLSIGGICHTGTCNSRDCDNHNDDCMKSKKN